METENKIVGYYRYSFKKEWCPVLDDNHNINLKKNEIWRLEKFIIM